MTTSLNELGQPIGESVSDWPLAQFPPYTAFEGSLCRIEPIAVQKHAIDLFEAYAIDVDDRMWTYMTYGPFSSIESVERWLEQASQKTDPQFYVLVEKKTNKAVGLASYMRIKPEHGAIEVGGISFSPHLQRTALATEIMYLMMKRAFEDLGYRRYEWKCDALNLASCKAAERFGFSYDGTFKKHIIYQGRNRDTAWYSILDDEWPQLKKAYLQWLAPENLDEKGQQLEKLADLINQTR
jgi:RimJ/RimL family protein N-acetyltransferase